MSPQTGNRKRNLILGTVGVIALAVIAVVAMVVKSATTPNPTFPSLMSAPDASLHGTVAYFDDASMCIHVVSASGAGDTSVFCVQPQDKSTVETDGKDVGVNIVWRTDNRLELTLFRMDVKSASPTFKPAWQKIVVPATKAVEDVPLAQVAKDPTAPARPTSAPNGDNVEFTSTDGHVTVTWTTNDTRATVMDVKGNPEVYRLEEAFWSPDFQWIAANDGHLLVITKGGMVRQLTPALTQFYGYDALHWYDITAADLVK